MLTKLKTECGEFCFWRKWVLQSVLSVLTAYGHLQRFLIGYKEASLGEYMVFSLTSDYYIMVMLPFLCLAWTTGKNREACRYPLLLRYRTRNAFFFARFLAKALFAMAALLSHIGSLLIAGRNLTLTPQMLYVPSGHPAGIVVMQCLNLFCYVCVMILLCEMLTDAAGSARAGVVLTASSALVNLAVARGELKSVAAWMPWAHLGYVLYGRARPDYHFYGSYWVFLLLLLCCLAEEWNGRRDYVFEETRKTD